MRKIESNILQIKARHVRALMQLPGVAGVGVSEQDGEAIIQIYVRDKTSETLERLPKQLEGVRVAPVCVGKVKAQ